MSNEQEKINREFARSTAGITRRSSTVRTGRAAASSNFSAPASAVPSWRSGTPRRPTSPASGVTTKNTAQNVIFILLAGAPSHTDTFDLKMVAGVTPASFDPQTVNGIAVAHRADAEARRT